MIIIITYKYINLYKNISKKKYFILNILVRLKIIISFKIIYNINCKKIYMVFIYNYIKITYIFNFFPKQEGNIIIVKYY